MSVLIEGMQMPETEYMDVRIFRDGTATLATGTKPYYRELKAEPVRHGKWIHYKDEHTCSKCGETVTGDWNEDYDYCPNCGADMRGESDD